MLIKTHIAASVFVALSLWESITGKIAFTILLLFSTLLPDIDSSASYINRRIKPLDKIFNFLTKHRGILHSMTFCIILTVIFASFNQKLALPFFLGYSLHLVADSFTVIGIKPFWPSTKVIKGFIRTGGLIERILLCSLIIADVILFIAIIT